MLGGMELFVLSLLLWCWIGNLMRKNGLVGIDNRRESIDDNIAGGGGVVVDRGVVGDVGDIDDMNIDVRDMYAEGLAHHKIVDVDLDDNTGIDTVAVVNDDGGVVAVVDYFDSVDAAAYYNVLNEFDCLVLYQEDNADRIGVTSLMKYYERIIQMRKDCMQVATLLDKFDPVSLTDILAFDSTAPNHHRVDATLKHHEWVHVLQVLYWLCVIRGTPGCAHDHGDRLPLV